MRVASFDTLRDFEDAVGAWLAQEPRRNNLILSILHRSLKSAESAQGWVVSSASGPEIALLQTPPHPPSMSDGSLEAAQHAARFLPPDQPGIAGPSAVSDA